LQELSKGNQAQTYSPQVAVEAKSGKTFSSTSSQVISEFGKIKKLLRRKDYYQSLDIKKLMRILRTD